MLIVLTVGAAGLSPYGTVPGQVRNSENSQTGRSVTGVLEGPCGHMGPEPSLWFSPREVQRAQSPMPVSIQHPPPPLRGTQIPGWELELDLPSLVSSSFTVHLGPSPYIQASSQVTPLPGMSPNGRPPLPGSLCELVRERL